MDGQNDMSVKMNKVFVILLILITLFSSMSCSNATAEYRDKRHVEKILKEYYGGEFVVHETYHKQGQLFAEAAWVDIPGHVFTVCVTETSIDYRYTNEPFFSIVEKGIEDTIADYMQEYYPGCFYRVSIMDLRYVKNRGTTINSYDEILEEATSITGCYLLIFVDKEFGTAKQYEEEYMFYTDVVDSLVKQDRMLPVSVGLYQVEENDIGELKKYLEKSDDDNDFYNHIRVYKKISACFKKNMESFVNTYDEYEQLRKKFDDYE